MTKNTQKVNALDRREAEAWRSIAKGCVRLHPTGLCSQVAEVEHDKVRMRMDQRLHDYRAKRRLRLYDGFFWWPRTPEGYAERKRVCLAFAAQCVKSRASRRSATRTRTNG